MTTVILHKLAYVTFQRSNTNNRTTEVQRQINKDHVNNNKVAAQSANFCNQVFKKQLCKVNLMKIKINK